MDYSSFDATNFLIFFAKTFQKVRKVKITFGFIRIDKTLEIEADHYFPCIDELDILDKRDT